MGGNCCGIGSACLSGNRCTSTIDPATVDTASATSTPTISGAADNAAVVSTDAGASSRDDASGGGGGLSAGATAGVAVAGTMGGLSLIGLIVWFVTSRRRRRRQRGQPGRPADGFAEPLVYSPGPGTMSQMPSPAAASTGQDYFPREGAAGPFTSGDAADESGLTAYMANHGAVPVDPQEPGDIRPPVEIDTATASSAVPGRAHVAEGGTGQSPRPSTHGSVVPGRLELA